LAGRVPLSPGPVVALLSGGNVDPARALALVAGGA
ncbi:MAG: threonine/serine dehydratase, partial [Gemmatimonadetes bacterium]